MIDSKLPMINTSSNKSLTAGIFYFQKQYFYDYLYLIKISDKKHNETLIFYCTIQLLASATMTFLNDFKKILERRRIK